MQTISSNKKEPVTMGAATQFRLIENGTIVVVIAAFFLFFLSSCNSNRLYEENMAVPNEQWNYDDIKEFSVVVEDTSIRYNILVNLRHSFAFDWRNLYVKIATEFPDGKKTDSRVNLLLSEPDGRWFARCIGDNCFISIPVKENIKFPQKGKYSFAIRQDMRQNPLPKIKYVGFRIEKAEYNYGTSRLQNLF